MPKAEIRLQPHVAYQAKAVMACLERAVEGTIVNERSGRDFDTLEDLEDLRIQTYVLHNCRENGYCLVATHGYGGAALLVFFAEHRNTDSLFVWTEEVKGAPFNGPSIDDFGEESYKRRKMFGDKYEDAAEHICKEIAAFHAKRAEEEAERKAKKAG